MDLYAENILDHSRHPHRKSLLREPTVDREEANASCGDKIRLQLWIADGKVNDVGWEGDGCAVSQASMSLLADELIGMSAEEAERLSATDIKDLLGIDVGPRRTKCALLSLHALKNALREVRGTQPQSWSETLGSDR